MSRAVVSHFDGDPFTLSFWLNLYDRYWRGEADKVYISIFYNPLVIPEWVIEEEMVWLNKYSEIKILCETSTLPPEKGNERLLKMVEEDEVGFIESDGFIYGRGIVDQCFRLLSENDVVAPSWPLIDEPYFNGDLNSTGFMRCFFFIKGEVLRETDCDFMPKTISANTRLTDKYSTGKDVSLDCFGWMSWQILLLTNKICYTPNNILTPDNILLPYSNFKWVHVRQMSSSALGLGGGEFNVWLNGGIEDKLRQVFKVINYEFPNGSGEFIYEKAIAFKRLFLETNNSEKLEEFALNYERVLNMAVDYLGLQENRINKITGFYKGLFNV